MKKQKSGLYRTRVKVGTGSDGKSVYKYISGKTKKELDANRDKAIEEYITGRSVDNMLFGTYAEQWFEVRKKPFLANGSVKMYRSALDSRILPAFKNRNLKAISAMDIQMHLNRLSAEGLSKARVNSIRNILAAVFDSAMQDGYITVNPAKHMRVGGKPAEEKHALTPKERTAIEQICATHPDGLILAMLYYTGLRGGEARALQWKHIDLRTRTIHVSGSLKHDDGSYIGKTKTESSVRDIPILSPLYDLLTKQPIGLPETFVLHGKNPGTPLMEYRFRILYTDLMYAAGLATELPKSEVRQGVHYKPLITPHGFRHNFATMCWESGTIDAFSAAKLLGHSSIKTTMDTYTHLSAKGYEQTAEKLESAFVAQLLHTENSNP